jgi:hypothetical protein
VTLSLVSGSWRCSAVERAPSTTTDGKAVPLDCANAANGRQARDAAAASGRSERPRIGVRFMMVILFLIALVPEQHGAAGFSRSAGKAVAAAAPSRPGRERPCTVLNWR